MCCWIKWCGSKPDVEVVQGIQMVILIVEKVIIIDIAAVYMHGSFGTSDMYSESDMDISILTASPINAAQSFVVSSSFYRACKLVDLEWSIDA